MPSTVELVCVDPERVHDVWAHVAPRIRSAIERTGLSDFAELERDVLRGGQQLWLAWNGEAIEAAATTHLTLVGPQKVCVITTCAGEHMKQWLPLLSYIERYAKAEGCAIIRIFGRHGWQRVLPEYEVSNVVLDKEL